MFAIESHQQLNFSKRDKKPLWMLVFPSIY